MGAPSMRRASGVGNRSPRRHTGTVSGPGSRRVFFPQPGLFGLASGVGLVPVLEPDVASVSPNAIAPLSGGPRSVSTAARATRSGESDENIVRLYLNDIGRHALLTNNAEARLRALVQEGVE